MGKYNQVEGMHAPFCALRANATYFLNTIRVGPLHLWIQHPLIQPTSEQKCLEKNFRKF